MQNSAPYAFSYTELANREFLYEAQSPAPAGFAPDEGADTIIIGGGYTGLSAALHLAKSARAVGEPVNVTLLEAGRIGSGASGKSGGHVNGGFQQSNEATILKKFATPQQGKHMLSVINQGPALVAQLIGEHGIDCDLRKGYVFLHDDGSQTFDPEGGMGIEPYPYVLGLAKAARDLGVKIYEHTPVEDIIDHGGSCEIQTSRGPLAAGNILCSGGHRMAETIPFLKDLRKKTLELVVTTICTDPLPAPVIKALMPDADGGRYPFCDENVDVSFGSIDRHGRMIFGAKVGTKKVEGADVAAKMFALFPDLAALFKKATGQELSYRTFVSNETLNFTANMLPNVGQMGTQGRVRYVHALGGHGIALGTMLGKIAAADITGENTSDFSMLAKVKHMNLPTWQPLRLAATWAGVAATKTYYRAENALRQLTFNG